MFDSNESEKRNQIIMPVVGDMIENFYNLLMTNKSDPFLLPGRVYNPIKESLFKLRMLGGHFLAQSFGEPQTTYMILKRFDELIESFNEHKRLFGSDFSLSRAKVESELASIKEFAEFGSSKILHKFK